MKRRVRLTEGDLHRIVRESVKRVLYEGQGWNMFKSRHKKIWNGDLDNDEEARNDPRGMAYIKHGDPDGPEDGFSYYDDEGDPTRHETDSQGRRNKRINTGLGGKIGRAAGVAGVKGSLMARNVYNKLRGKH